MSKSSSESMYSKLGASASKEGLHKILDSSGLELDHRLFAPVLPDLAGDEAYRSFIHCDGAGTKSSAAYLYYKETGDKSIFAGLAADALAMNLDDIYCIGKPDSLQLANLIGRNAACVDDSIIAVLIESYLSLIKQMQEFGIPIQMTGGETADCGDVVRTLLVDAVVTGRIAKKELLFASNIRPGLAIVGLASSGQASYENKLNSGIGSNGLTLARHSLLKNSYLSEHPESSASESANEFFYKGPFAVSDTDEELGMSIGEALCSPTRSFAPVLHQLYAEHPNQVVAAIHLTGGAHTKVLRFAKGCLFEKDSLPKAPRIFELIQEHGKVDPKEMYQVLNMGTRMELYVEPEFVDSIVKVAANFNIEAQRVGTVLAHPKGKDANSSVRIITDSDEFNYSL